MVSHRMFIVGIVTPRVIDLGVAIVAGSRNDMSPMPEISLLLFLHPGPGRLGDWGPPFESEILRQDVSTGTALSTMSRAQKNATLRIWWTCCQYHWRSHGQSNFQGFSRDFPEISRFRLMWPLTVFMLITSCLVSDHTHWIPEITRERLVSGQWDGADRWENPVVGFQYPRELEVLPYLGMIGAIGMLTITTCHNLFSANHQMPWLWFGMLKHVETQERNQAQWRCVAAIASQLCCVAGVGPWHDSVPRLATHRACQCHATAAHQGCQAHQTAWCRQAKLVTQLSCFMVQNVQNLSVQNDVGSPSGPSPNFRGSHEAFTVLPSEHAARSHQASAIRWSRSMFHQAPALDLRKSPCGWFSQKAPFSSEISQPCLIPEGYLNL